MANVCELPDEGVQTRCADGQDVRRAALPARGNQAVSVPARTHGSSHAPRRWTARRACIVLVGWLVLPWTGGSISPCAMAQPIDPEQPVLEVFVRDGCPH